MGGGVGRVVVGGVQFECQDVPAAWSYVSASCQCRGLAKKLRIQSRCGAVSARHLPACLTTS
eukprot:3786956-Rhodomonas_salina.3